MSLSILNNISALTAQNQLSITQSNLAKTLTQLSSGLKINTGADDAAGLSIANGMQANISALTQSAQNATNGTGMLQTADGALSQITSLLNRAVTLATEASNGGLNATQSTALNTEFQSILNEITSIGTTTTFNGSAIFKAGTVTDYSQLQAGTGLTRGTAITASAIDIHFSDAVGTNLVNGLADVSGATTVGGLIDAINSHTSSTNLSASLTADGKLVVSDTTGSGTIGHKLQVTGLGYPSAAANAGATDDKNAAFGTALTADSLINAGSLSIKVGAGAEQATNAMKTATTVQELMDAINNAGDATMSASLTAGVLKITDSDGAAGSAVTVTGLSTKTMSIANTNDNIMEVFQSDSTTAGQSVIKTTLNQLDASHLNGVDLTVNDLSSTTNAQKALVQINQAIGQVAALRGTIGANINQLSAAANVMSTQSQNLQSAKSGITDADVASTVANMTKYNILQSTGMAALQQANQSQQSVLKLLQ